MLNRRLFSFALSLITVFVLSSAIVKAQPRDRSYIKQQINYHNECRNVAITERNGDLMLYGSNGWAASGCPKGLTNALNALNEDGEYIDDVQLTENGRWLILYGDNGFRWNDIPYSLERKLREWNSSKEVITSVSFNDAGDWVAVCENYIAASDSDLQDWIAEGMEEYGAVWTTCITEDAMVVVYEEGFQTLGEIPSTLESKLTSTPIDVYRLKIAGEAWFISDGKSNYDYHM